VNAGETSYDALAREYYDPVAHPTCHNFNRLSRIYLERWVPEPWVDRNVLELGAGDSCAAAILHARGYLLNGLEITDASASMLAHSRRWEACGATLALSDATSLNREAASVALLVASLGDPYNLPEFWREAARVTKPGGVVLFTVPSFQWAARFRTLVSSKSVDEAEFKLRDGRSVSVPSFILPLDEQVRMIENAGLMVVHFESLGADALPPDGHSPKIDIFASDASSLVWGFRAIRQRQPITPEVRQCWKGGRAWP
jgi:SAM-dependent methyltransferase